MFGNLSRYKKTIVDLVYSFAAYALPTVVLQFAVQPYIARMVGAEANGLFLTLFNVVKLCVSVLIAPLASVRLLDKKLCEEEPLHDKGYNFLLLVVLAVVSAITAVFWYVYQGADMSFWGCVRLLAVLVLLSTHDFYAIAFRLYINYLMIVIDNILIVIGYGIGLFLMRWFPVWEIVFICGYILGLGYVILNSGYWKVGVKASCAGRLLPRYSQLCTSSGLGSATVYCDRMLIYPMLGGHAVSVYNAASVVSKIISVAIVPVRNVLLSYIVDKEKLSIPAKTIRKLLWLVLLALTGIYICFYGASWVFCKLLYSQFLEEAFRYVPIILLGVMLETCSGLMNIVVLRFARSNLQILLSATKISVYLLGILLLCVVWQLGLWGFCIAMVLAVSAQLSLETYYFIKILTVDNAA